MRLFSVVPWAPAEWRGKSDLRQLVLRLVLSELRSENEKRNAEPRIDTPRIDKARILNTGVSLGVGIQTTFGGARTSIFIFG